MPITRTNNVTATCLPEVCVTQALVGESSSQIGDTYAACDCKGTANELFAVSALFGAAVGKVTGGKQGQGKLAKKIAAIVAARIKAGDSPKDVAALKKSLEFAAITPEIAECPEGAILSDLVLGDLSPRDAVAVAGHAASCPKCFALVGAMKEFLETPKIEPKGAGAGSKTRNKGAAARKSEGLRLLSEAREMERAGRPNGYVSAKYSAATNVLISNDPEYAKTHPDAILTAGHRLFREGQYHLAGEALGKCAAFFAEQGMNKLAAWTYTRQGTAYMRSRAFHWAAQAFYEARELYSKLDPKFGTEEKNKALEEMKKAVRKDMLPHIEEALKEVFGVERWNLIRQAPGVKEGLANVTYTEIEAQVLSAFYEGVSSPGTETTLSEYQKLKRGGVNALVVVSPSAVSAITNVVRESIGIGKTGNAAAVEAKAPTRVERPGRPEMPERPAAIGREHGRDGVDGKGPGRDKDAEGRKGPKGRRGRGPRGVL